MSRRTSPRLPPERDTAVDSARAQTTAPAAHRARRRRVERALRRDQPVTVPRWVASGGWSRFLKLYHALDKPPEPAARLAWMQRAFQGADRPEVRQNFLFLAVLTLPAEIAHPWVRTFLNGGSPGDRADAIVALAFNGDAAARADLLSLRAIPLPAPLALDTLDAAEVAAMDSVAGSRQALRSFRAYEVLARQPYFERIRLYTEWKWLPHPAGDDPQLGSELWRQWLRLWPGHSGSDDIAWRLGGTLEKLGQDYEAARWYRRASIYPDHDLVHASVRDLIRLAETRLLPEQVDQLASESGLDTPNRQLLQYIRVRRIAAERGVAPALRVAAALATADPRTRFAYAWRNRFAAPVPKGLGSGLWPVARSDPLRAVEQAERSPPAGMSPIDSVYRLHWDPMRRATEPLPLDTDRLRKQFRAWETLAALEERARQAGGQERADLLYRQAAVLYHESRVYFPVYASEGERFRDYLGRANADRIALESFHLMRAAALFDRIEREHRGYQGMDRVFFSRALCYRKLVDYRPYSIAYPYREEGKRRHRELVADLITGLERCRDEFPGSPLADDAARAAAYWRRRE